MTRPAFSLPEVLIVIGREEGSGFFLLGQIGRKMRAAGLSESECAKFVNEATSTPDFEAMLGVVEAWCTVRRAPNANL